ncbi:hypothetical protein BaRGS_00013085, partial [Batillaria attramentaria]
MVGSTLHSDSMELIGKFSSATRRLKVASARNAWFGPSHEGTRHGNDFVYSGLNFCWYFGRHFFAGLPDDVEEITPQSESSSSVSRLRFRVAIAQVNGDSGDNLTPFVGVLRLSPRE